MNGSNGQAGIFCDLPGSIICMFPLYHNNFTVLLVDIMFHYGTAVPFLYKYFISGAKVNGIFEEAYRDKTVDVIKYKQKSRYYKKYGHRQPHFKVRIESLK